MTDQQPGSPEDADRPANPAESAAAPQGDASQDAVERTETSEVRIRRAPKYSAFITLGALLGAVIALIVSLLSPPAEDLSVGQVFGYLVLFGLPLGAMVGAGVALLLDGLSRRRERRATAGKLSVRAQEDSGEDSRNPS